MNPTVAANTFPNCELRAAATADGAVAARLDISAVYAAHFRFVWRCLRSLGVSDSSLDDALQDVFLVVQRKLAEFDGDAKLSTWLYAIVLRIARRYRSRAAKDAQKFVADDEPGEDPGDLERDVERGQRLALARRALEELDDDKREAFVLACVEQMSAPEIAEITGVPVNTVYSRIRAARIAFSAHLARLDHAPIRRSR